MAGQVYHAWNTTIKLQVVRGTHTYFVDRVLTFGISHVKTDIFAKYVKFFSLLREKCRCCHTLWPGMSGSPLGTTFT